MADSKTDTKTPAAPASPTPAPTPVPAPVAAAPSVPLPAPPPATPPPKADAKSRAVTVAIWGGLAWVFLRLIPQNKLPGVLKGIGSMFWEALALGGTTAVETVKAAARWSDRHGRRALRFSIVVASIAGIFFILGNEYEVRWPIGVSLVLTIPLAILAWLVIKALRAVIYEATQAFGTGISIFGRTAAALLRKAGVVIPDASAPAAAHEKCAEAIDKHLEKIFLAMAGGLTFLFLSFWKPGWETVGRMVPVAFLVIIVGFFSAHLKIESKSEVRVVRGGLRILLWFSAAAVLLPYSASVVVKKDFDKTLGDWLTQQGIGFSSIGILLLALGAITWLWLRGAMLPKQVKLDDGSVGENPGIPRANALAVAGTILIPLAVIFLFWRGDITVAELKGEQTKTGTEERAERTSEPAKSPSPVTTGSGATPTGATPQAFTGGGGAQATTRLDLPEPQADNGSRPSRPTTVETPAPQPPPAQARPAKRDTKPRRYSNFLEATDALDQAGL